MTETISSDYLAQQQALHTNKRYGVASVGYAPIVLDILEKTKFSSLCDYGAGKCRLWQALPGGVQKKMEYHPYDPAFPEYGPPTPADVVSCIDVLEHIEPELLQNVIQELAGLTREVGFFTIHTGPAKKILADGRNAHLIQQPISWWLGRLLKYFEIIQVVPVKRGFWVIVQPIGKNNQHYFQQQKPKPISWLRKLRYAVRSFFKPSA